MTTFQNLNPTDKEIAQATCGVLVRTLSDDDLAVKMTTLITNTHFKAGYKFDAIQVGQTLRELCSDIVRYFPSATFEEIELAFKNGYKEEYGEYFGLNNKTYFHWIGAYFHGEKRSRIKKTLLEAKENANKQPEKKTETESDYILKNACLKSFDDFRKGVVIFDAGNVKYNYLVKCGIINFTKERKQEIRTIVESRMRTQAIENRQKSESIEKSIAKILPESIISESRREALVVFYKDLIETETELIDLLN